MWLQNMNGSIRVTQKVGQYDFDILRMPKLYKVLSIGRKPSHLKVLQTVKGMEELKLGY
jgi:hypothetical protein